MHVCRKRENSCSGCCVTVSGVQQRNWTLLRFHEAVLVNIVGRLSGLAPSRVLTVQRTQHLLRYCCLRGAVRLPLEPVSAGVQQMGLLLQGSRSGPHVQTVD
jgi:hypothetical protein